MKKKLLILSWLLVLISGPILILIEAPIPITAGNIGYQINFLQRITALIAFSALFMQIVIGANLSKLSKAFGSWINKFHTLQGIVAYTFVLAHPLLFLFYNFKTRGSLDPFYVFTDVCLLCPRPYELHWSFGRIGFWLISFVILAAILRSESWWKKNWRKFHILNYFVFFLIAAHAWFSGTDIVKTSFVYIFWFEITVVVYTLFRKFLFPLIIISKKSA
jgi:predicted ferric reductase